MWLFSRNDALANVAVIVAAGLVAVTGEAWPDPHSSAGPKLALLHPRNHAVSFGALSSRALRARPVEPETRDKGDHGRQLFRKRLSRRVHPNHPDLRKLCPESKAPETPLLQPPN